jgi:hypothetical protein
MKKISYLAIAMLSVMSANVYAAVDSGLTVLNDQELASETGQALFNLQYLAPTDTGSNSATNGNVGFYKLGMEAEVALNTNIKKLQLGCGGANGAGACDIDIDNFSLSGLSDTREGRVQSDAVLTNPFIQLAIKNPGTASTRELVGVRLSAEQIVGMLTFGTENSDTPNGINSLSGYLKLSPATGTAKTIERTMTQAIGNMTGRISVRNAWPLSSDPRPFSSNDYTLTLASANAPFTTRVAEISGKRMQTVTLKADSTIPSINFSGPLAATINVAGFIPITLQKNVTGSITNLGVEITIQENLGFIHKIPVNGNPFSLSLQGQDILWPGATKAAEKGWWLAFEDEIAIGSVTPSNDITITNALLGQVLPKVNAYLYDNPIDCDGYSGCLGGSLPITDPINLLGSVVNLPLDNLKLSAQGFAPNCYGTLKFC